MPCISLFFFFWSPCFPTKERLCHVLDEFYEQSGLSFLSKTQTLNNSFDCGQQMNCNADTSFMEIVVALQFNVVFQIFVG